MHSDEVCTCFCFTFCVKLKKCLSIRSFKVNLRNPVNQEPEVVWGEVTGHVESLKRFEREREIKKKYDSFSLFTIQPLHNLRLDPRWSSPGTTAVCCRAAFPPQYVSSILTQGSLKRCTSSKQKGDFAATAPGSLAACCCHAAKEGSRLMRYLKKRRKTLRRGLLVKKRFAGSQKSEPVRRGDQACS